MIKSKGLLIAILTLILLLLVVSSAGSTLHSAESDKAGDGKVVVIINLTGTISAGSTNMFRSELSDINNSTVKAVVINMNAGGGILAQALDMDKYINSAESKGIPVYSYVMPFGSASYAGTYIAMDANGLYMAPGTSIGLSEPTIIGGTAAEDQENTANYAALMGNMASAHGRNSTAAENMVVHDTDYTASEAAGMNLSSGISSSLNAMLGSLNLSSYTRQYVNQNVYDNFLNFIGNPLVAGILILIGIVTVFLDLYHGTIILSIAGFIMIALGLLGADIINASIFGLILLLLAGILIFIEFKTNHGIALLAGLITGIAGIYFLASSYGTSNPGYSPSPFGPDFYLASVVIVLTGILLIVYLSKILKSQEREHYTGGESLIGHSASVITPMKRNQTGFVSIEGVQWRALNAGVDVNQNDKVIIIQRKGLTLTVKKI
ncbi:NfeD family protein [Ferroplasma sp.]|uniref:NfeD family protein n=1 Tax=Ferroplasma sp. TaxID=2591003 RepID=UPI00307FA8C7